MDARRRLAAAALAALLCGTATACAKHATARTGLGPLGGASASPGAGGPGGGGGSAGQGAPGVGGATPSAAPNPGTTPHGGGGAGGGSGTGGGGGGTTTSPSASTSSDPPSGPPGKGNPPVFKFPNYSIVIAENPGKICAWRITPGGTTDISIGFSVKLGYYGSPSPQPETVTLSSDLTTRTEVITVTPDPGTLVLADLEISGFNYTKTPYTMHMTATIAPTGGDLITSDNTVSATLSVPAFYPPNGSYFTTIPCS